MLKIKTNKGHLDLGGDFTVQIDEKSPIMNDRGSQTVPVTVPCTGNNARITGFVHRLDMGSKPMNGDQTCTVSDGAYKRTGKINIVSAGKKEGITLNIGFDNSEAYSAWKAKKLNTITLPVKTYDSVDALCQHLQHVLDGVKEDYAVFQIMTGNDLKDNQAYPKYLNYISPIPRTRKRYRLRYQARKETFLINGTPTETTLPAGYGITAFLYVWRVLELIFTEFGYTIMENPFKNDRQLCNLVILNNAADCCVKGKLSYADLMPDCTVEEFLNALHVRFGMVYSISSDTKTATLRLIRDIVEDSSQMDISQNLSEEPLITYDSPRQIKLSAKTSFTGAAPSVERFEDYLKGQKVARLAKVDVSKRVIHLNYEETTGRWFKWDEENNRLAYSSSSFFAWDRKTDNIEDNELSSQDECVPMDFAPNDILSPQYLADYVHRYTYLKTSSNKEGGDSEKQETPLSFVFAFMSSWNSKYPFGSVLPYTSDGKLVQIKGGREHTISLLFQYENGLFANFWKKYDAILRHSFNQVEADLLLPVHQLMNMDLLKPVAFRGQTMLWDNLSYSLPARGVVPVSTTLRSLRLIGPYDLDDEQKTPDFGSLLYSWEFRGSNLEEAKEKEKNRILQQARDEWNKQRTAVSGIKSIDFSTEGYITRDQDKYLVENYPESEGILLHRNYKCKATAKVTLYYGSESIHKPPTYRDVIYETVFEYTDTFYSITYAG